MTADLSAALTITRDVVQTFAEALTLLTEGDLHRWPNSSSALSQRIGGTRIPDLPYERDHGLRERVLRGLQQTHDCVMTLAQLDCVSEPTAFDDAPLRHLLPSLQRMQDHLANGDRSLADVQHHLHGLAPMDRETALDACAHITGVVGETVVFTERALTTSKDGSISTRREWDAYARRARMQCAECWRLSGRAMLCQECDRPDPDACRNPGRRTQCLSTIGRGDNAKRKLCKSCDQARRNALRDDEVRSA